MVPHDLYGAGYVPKELVAVMRYHGGLSMHEAAGAHHPASEGFSDRLMSQAYSEYRDPSGSRAHQRHRDPRVFRRPGARGDHNGLRPHGKDLIRRQRIVAVDGRLRAEIPGVLDQVVCETVVVIKNKEHGECYFRALESAILLSSRRAESARRTPSARSESNIPTFTAGPILTFACSAATVDSTTASMVESTAASTAASAAALASESLSKSISCSSATS